MASVQGFCQICCLEFTPDHKGSLEHAYNFKLMEWRKYRKALVKNREGITLSINPQHVNYSTFDYDYDVVKGKHKVKILVQQLKNVNNTIIFACKIANKSANTIYIQSLDMLYPDKIVTIQESIKILVENDHNIELKSGAEISFNIIFHISQLVYSNFVRPFICTFQTCEKKVFTIARSLSVLIRDENEETIPIMSRSKTLSSWSNVGELHASTQKQKYVDNYPIPSNYRYVLKYGLKMSKDFDNTNRDLLNQIKDLLSPNVVTLQNYQDYFHIILWLDEVAQELQLECYNMDKVTVKWRANNLLELDVLGLAEKRPSIVVGDQVRLRLHDDHVAYIGHVRRVNNTNIHIAYVEDDFIGYLKAYSDAELDVSFKLGRLVYERMHEGVDKVVKNGMTSILFDSNTVPKKNKKCCYVLHDSEILNELILQNHEQKMAVTKILNMSSPAPYIVYGPPGTGKTITIVEAILQIKLKTNKRILVCAPANSACDMITLHLMKHCTPTELIRIHSDTRDMSNISKTISKYSNLDGDGDFRKITPQQCMSFRIIVTTLVLIGRYSSHYHPDCVFIDEAAQAAEPQANIAIGMIKLGKQVVLAGDPKQLGPVCASKLAMDKYGLGISLLERLMEKNKLYSTNYNIDNEYLTMLKLNFRSHPLILSLPNTLFYKNLLMARSLYAFNDPITKISIYPKIFENKSLPTDGGKSVEFCAVFCKEEKANSPSYFNRAEVNMVVKYVKALLKIKLDEPYEMISDQIGIVTPYVKQVAMINQRLNQSGLTDVEVGTTESFQGREKRVIIISTVRAQSNLLLHDRKYNLGFVRNDKRFNVALTRAMSKLIVIGCPRVLETDTKWEAYMDLCNKHNVFFGAPYVKVAKSKRKIMKKFNNLQFPNN